MRQQPFLLPGEDCSGPVTSVARPRSSPLLRIVVMVWLVGGLVFFLIRFASGRRVSGQVLPQQATTALTAISTEDLLHHMEGVNKELAAAAVKLHRVEDHISLAIPSIKRS